MSVPQAPTAQGAPVSRARGWQERAWTTMRCAALVAMLCLAVVTLAAGHKVTSYQRFTDELKSGSVHDVMVSGALEPGAVGFTHPTLVWKDGWLTRETTVLQVSDESHLADAGEVGQPRITGDVATAMRQDAPSIHVHPRPERTSFGTVAGWTVPDAVTISCAIVWALTLGLLRGGPEPLLGTRWAWTWALLSPAAFIAAPAYLTFGVGLKPDDQSRQKRRRITGGWAFLLVIFCLGGFGFSHA